MVVRIGIEKRPGILFFLIEVRFEIKTNQPWFLVFSHWQHMFHLIILNFNFFIVLIFFFLNYFSGGNKKSSSIAQLAIPATSPRELLGSEQQQKQMDHHPASGFGTKDSSDSKSHDSGIDSIEKPGMSFGVLGFVG